MSSLLMKRKEKIHRMIIAFSRTYPNFASQAREIEIFCEDCKLAAPLDLAFFRVFGPRSRVH